MIVCLECTYLKFILAEYKYRSRVDRGPGLQPAEVRWRLLSNALNAYRSMRMVLVSQFQCSTPELVKLFPGVLQDSPQGFTPGLYYSQRGNTFLQELNPCDALVKGY